MVPKGYCITVAPFSRCFLRTKRACQWHKTLFGRIIPFKGSWIEFATDINNVMYAYIDRKKKLPVTTLLRAIGFEGDKDILEIFGSGR
jgi:DNA-directed RNA polymerase subunit beta